MFPHRTHSSSFPQITSLKNPLLKDIRRAVARGALTDEGFCVAESRHLLSEAIRSGCDIQAVLVADSAWEEVMSGVGQPDSLPLIRVPDSVLGSISSTETTQGVIVLVRPPVHQAEELFRETPLLVILDGIQDPGNAGTIIRTAEAFGATGAVLLKGTVNPWNPKALRSSAGSIFRVPFLSGMDAGSLLTLLRERAIDLWAAMPRASHTLDEIDLRSRAAIAIGSEGRGIGDELASAVRHFSIPTTNVESLNAAAATAVVLYEAARQRRLQ